MGRKLGLMLLEVLLIVGSSFGLAWGVNAQTGRIDINRDFFALTPKQVSSDATDGSQDAANAVPSEHNPQPRRHGWQVISTDDVAALVDDPNTEGGLNVIIDARKADLYAKGHMPFAIRIYPYTAAEELPTYHDRLSEALKIVVYCGGGACEDSSIMCRELQDKIDVAYEKIFLYEGGFSEWEKSKKPVHTGDEP